MVQSNMSKQNKDDMARILKMPREVLDTQWRSSTYHSGDVAWLKGPTGGVLYRIKTITTHKYEVAFGGHFYRHWHTFGSALSKAEAKTMCENHAIASRVLEAIEE